MKAEKPVKTKAVATKASKKKTAKKKTPLPPIWDVDDLHFDENGRLVINDPELKAWFLKMTGKVFGVTKADAVSTNGTGKVTIGSGRKPDLVKECDIIVVGHCGVKPPVPEKKCDILVVGSCGSSSPKMDTKCTKLVGGKPTVPASLKSCETAQLNIIIRRPGKKKPKKKP